MNAPPTPLAAIRARRLGDFSDEALLWLALPPTWTLPLAAWCEFPAGKLPLPTIFENAVRTGLALSDAPARSEIRDQRSEIGFVKDGSSPVSGLQSPDSNLHPPPKSPDLSGYDPALLADLGLASSASTAVATYWAAPGTRGDILTRTLADRSAGQATLRKTAGLIGERIRRFPEPAAVPPATRRWAELAAPLAKPPGDAAAVLDRRLEALLVPGKADTDEALRWIEAAAPLAELFGGEMLAAVQRAGARLELFHRRDFDRRHLRRFLERAEQMQAFDDLLSSPPNEWALHFIGLGGVGKTMLVRHLTLLLTDDERFEGRAACARVDFDHLSPEYPTAAPGLLLERLSTELALYGQTRASSRAFERFHDRVKTLHEGMPPPVLGAPLPLPTDDSKFLDVLAVFIEALRTLPQPVVLILDTCEELARISAGGDAPLNVRATFAVLEQMQSLAQRAGAQVRVIFCGRRPLASAGAGWQWPTAQPLPPRPYLRLHAIRGFTHDEARTFLTARAGVPAEPADRIAAIIERSPEYGRLEGLIFTDPARAPADAPRCSPFDLDLIAAWVREAPDLDAQTIRSADADQYIDLRIMGRLQPRALRDLMPAVALLGRFDLPMLAAAAGDPDSSLAARPAAPPITVNAFTFGLRGPTTSQAAAPPPQTELAAPETELAAPQIAPGDAVRSRWQDLFDALARQEWMDRQDPFLEVDRLLLPKLRAYFMRRDEEALDLAGHRGAAYLRALTLAAPTDALSTTHLDNALRLLLSDNPTAAPAWWAQIEERFANPRDWPWLETVCDRILARGGAVGAFRPSGWWRGQPLSADAQAEWEEDRRRLAAEGRLDGSDTPLRAAALATYNAALLHLRRPQDLLERWQEALAILTTAAAPPTAVDEDAPRRRLTLRAAAGCLATAPADLPAEPRAAWLERLAGLIRPDQPTDPQAIAALRAVAEPGQAPRADLLAAAGASAPALPLELRTWAALLTARELAGRGQLTAALASARQALELTRAPGAARSNFTWLDWLPPADLNARVRLEFSQLVCPALLAPADALAEIGAQPPSPGTLDADRLGAKLLELHAASAAPNPDAYAALALPVAAGVARAAAIHDATPPLFAALAVARAETGAVDEAIEALRQAQTAAESAVNLAGQRAILAARLAIVRQFRLRDVGLGADIGSGLVSQTVYPQIQPQLLATAGLAAPGAQPVAILADVAHAWWRSRPMHSADDLQAALALLPAWTPGPDTLANPTFDEASRLFDEQERIYLDQQWPSPAPRRGDSAPRCDAAAWQKAHPHEPVQALILHLRSLALTPAAPGAPTDLAGLAARVGIRRAAQVAWDEGELLALRLPQRAIILLQQATAWAEQAGDAVLGFRVQITLALAAAYAGQQKTLDQALQGAKALFPRLPFVNLSLLSWDDLTVAAQDGDIVRVGGLMNKAPRWPLGWQPWLVRAIAAQAALLALQKRPSGLSGILEWAARSFGVTADDKTVRLPPELEALRSLPGKATDQPTPSPLRARLGKIFSANNLVMVLGLAIVAAFVGGIYWLFNQGLSRVAQTLGMPSDQEIGTPARIGLFLALLFVIGLAAQIPTLLRRQFRTRSRPQLTLRLAGPTDANAAPTWRSLPPVDMTYSRLTWRWVWRWPFLMAQRTQLAQAASPAAAFSAYGGRAEPLLPTEIQQRLHEDQALLQRRACDMTVDVEPSLAQFGWEGLVVAALKEVKQPREAPLRLRRVLPGAQPAPQDEQPLPVVVASLADGFEQQEMAQRAWEASQKAGIALMVGGLAEGIERPPEPAPTVLHLQAAPTRATAGVRLKLSAAESLMTQSKFYQAERGRTLAVEDLPPRFERLRLVILQAPALGQTDARSEADYEEAALLRELAAALFLKGVPCIVTIPPLPAEVAPAALAGLTAALIRLHRAGGLDAERLSEAMLAAVRQARQDVAAAFGQNASAGFEAAWDLCLYAAEW